MLRLRLHIWLTICLLFPLSVEGQTVSAVDTAAMQRDDYIAASLLVVSPAAEVYSLFGHCALRLHCPSKDMDYCFTFETSTESMGLLNFFRGKAKGGYSAVPTSAYMDYYRQQGRSVTAYALNLTPAEKLNLWQQADREIALGFTYHYDYMRTQCASMLITLVSSVLPTPVSYRELPAQLAGSFRDQMLTESVPYPWSRFFWQTIMGPAGDDTEPLVQKTTPRLLPQLWQHTTLGSEERPLITASSQPQLLVTATPVDSTWLTPMRACTLLFIVVLLLTLCQFKGHCLWMACATDWLFLVFHVIVAIALTLLVLFSSLEATQWNCYLPVFNPLPEVLCLIRPTWLPWISRCLLVVILLTLLLTPFIPQLDWPQALLMATLGVRLTPRLKGRP